MRTFLSFVLIASFILGLGGIAWRFFEELEQSQVEELVLSTSGVLPENAEQQRLWDALVELTGVSPFSVRSLLTLAELQRSMAETSLKQEDRNQHLCQALHYVGRALKTHPYQAQWLLNWGNLRQVLGNLDCEVDYTSGDFADVVNYALDINRSDPELAFSAGLVFHWAGDNAQALACFRRALTFGKQATSSQMSFIAEQVKTPQDLLDLVPGLLPQVLSWSSYYKVNRPDKFKSFSKAFAKLQKMALTEGTLRFKEGQLPGQSYHDSLIALMHVSADDQIRKGSETALQSYLRTVGQSQLSAYLGARSKLSKLSVILGSFMSDTRPIQGTLFLWDKDSQVSLDSYFTSVGFYLPENQSVRLLELCARPGSVWPDEKQFKVFVSNDNQTWEETLDGNGFLRVKMGNQPCLVQWVKGGRHKYWKVHFSSGDRSNKFRNNLADLIKVYGLLRQ